MSILSHNSINRHAKACALLTGLSALLSLSVHAASDDVSSVHINVTANILYSGCTIVSDDQHQTIALGNFNGAKQLLGETGSSVPVSIRLNDCSQIEGVKVSLTPNFGVEGATNSAVLALSPASSAKGVGIEILDRDYHAVDFSLSSQVTQALDGESSELRFYARFKKIANEITPGSAETGMTYSIEYL